jgi:hypothetical protein
MHFSGASHCRTAQHFMRRHDEVNCFMAKM